MEPAYWERRLFRNTFTYKNRRCKVNGWSVKMQLAGKRKTFSLSSSNRQQAAVEASQIYQMINTHGWDVVGESRGRAPFRPFQSRAETAGASAIGFDVGYWKRRLIHRRYPEKTTEQGPTELSVRIEHLGVSRYFPLGTHDEDEAAGKALRIHQVMAGQGWGMVNQKFTQELTVAFRWLENPLAWTYTTLHTWNRSDLPESLTYSAANPNARRVAVIEPDRGIRLALAASSNQHETFSCCALYSNVAEAMREITRRRIDLVLINHALPDQTGSVCLEALQRAKPGLVGLLYSVFEDSDQLFKSTPGGAAGYLLKRTPPNRIFEPIIENSAPLTRELVAMKTREYFQRLVAAMPSGPSALQMARLTSREQEILALLAKGDPAKEIADTLGISIWTVHGHVKSVFEKLNVHTRTEAVVKFLQK